MQLKAPRNPNYAATVVQLKDFVELPGCDRIQAALIFGNHTIVGKDMKAGDIGLFFPVETALSHEFLSNNNLYRKPEFNKNPEAKGFFENHGRVKCVKFRGHKSEGFFIPMVSLTYLDGLDWTDSGWPVEIDEFDVGSTFDFIGEHEICKKYVPRHNPARLSKQQQKLAALVDQIVPNQFRFHPDTEQLRRNLHKIHPEDVISISDKWHGTSVVIAKVLTVRKLKWYEKVAKFLGVSVQETEQGFVYSSRKVVKSVNGVANTRAAHFYTEDIWGIVAREVEDKIPTGYTVYGEIVGFTPDGSAIQKGYHYGCPVGGHKFLVYRVTCTNADGIPLELSWPQMKEFCLKYGLDMVEELYYGTASHFVEIVPKAKFNLQDTNDFGSAFLDALEELYVHDEMCAANNNEVPAEGVVVRIDHLNDCEAFKLKNFAFLEWESKELDKGECDIETEQSEAVEEAA